MEIIATIPFAYIDDDTLKIIHKCHSLGIETYRFNFSKIGNTTNGNAITDKIKRIKETFGNDIKVIVDLPYPGAKPRLFFDVDFKYIKKGQTLLIATQWTYSKDFCGKINVMNCLDFFLAGGHYFCADGAGILYASTVSKDSVEFISQNDFKLSNRKSISSKNKIMEDIPNGITDILNEISPDMIMFSFVENLDFMEDFKRKCAFSFEPLIKIETQRGIDNIEQLCKHDCEVVVARGDLGIELTSMNLYRAQCNIIQTGRNNSRKVYVATDILSSMKESPFPSRADLIDLSIIKESAVDGVMLNAPVILSDNFESAVRIIRQ